MQCSQCGAVNHEAARFCLECGSRLEEHHPPAVAAPPQPEARTCPTCGVAIDGTERYCRNCGAYLGVPSAAPMRPASATSMAPDGRFEAQPVEHPVLTGPVLATFGQRLGASLIDLIVGVGILFLATFVVSLPVIASTGAENVNDLTDEQLNTMTLAAYGAAIVGFIIYSVAMEATNGATLGKRAVGLVVRTVDGRPIGFGAALVRGVLKPVLVLTVVGYLIIAWNTRRQSLYDMVAGTTVYRRDSLPSPD